MGPNNSLGWEGLIGLDFLACEGDGTLGPAALASALGEQGCCVLTVSSLWHCIERLYTTVDTLFIVD